MNRRSNPVILTSLGALVFVYFVVFPEDLKALTSPVAAVLELSHSLSPWLYMVIAVGIVTWGIVRVWGRKDGGSRT
jgi:hypothetical protein